MEIFVLDRVAGIRTRHCDMIYSLDYLQRNSFQHRNFNNLTTEGFQSFLEIRIVFGSSKRPLKVAQKALQVTLAKVSHLCNIDYVPLEG